MRYPWEVGCLPVLLACSGSAPRAMIQSSNEAPAVTATTGPDTLSADGLQGGGESEIDAVGQGLSAWPAGDQPELVLRCENGRVAAYVVSGASSDSADSVSETPVAVSLESTTDC